MDTSPKTDKLLPINVSWIGSADIHAMNGWRLKKGLPITPYTQKKIVEEDFKLRPAEEELGKNGPIRTLCDEMEFEKIYLLVSDEFLPDAEAVKEWVQRGKNKEIILVKTGVEDPTAYDPIAYALMEFKDEYLKDISPERLVFNITPGTPAISTVTVYMATVVFTESKLYKTTNPKHLKEGEPRFSEISLHLPFSLTGSYLDYSSKESTADKEELDYVIKAYARFPSVRILLLGETGVGKSSVAKKIHKACKGNEDNFVIANCAELAAGNDANMFRAELFGAKKGSYTGCIEDKVGLFEKAENGTIFLDEIAEIPLSSQSILLRALQDKEIMSVGGKKIIKLNNVRVISATNHNLIEEVKAGRFREDLYYRIATKTLTLPPLRKIASKNKDEFKEITNEALNKIMDELKKDGNTKEIKSISKEGWSALLKYPWPGNIRQLEHVLWLACLDTINNNKEQISEETLRSHLQESSALIPQKTDDEDFIPEDLDKYLDNLRMEFIKRAMKQGGGLMSNASELVGMNYQTFVKWAKQYGLKETKKHKK